MECDATSLSDQQTSASVESKCKWSIEEKKPSVTKYKGHKSPVLCLERNKGKVLASGSEDCTCRLWDTDTMKSIKCLIPPNKNPVNSIKFDDANESRVFVAAGDTVYLYDMRNSQVILSQPTSSYQLSDEVNQVPFTDLHFQTTYFTKQIDVRNNLLVSCDDSGEIKIIDTEKNSTFKTLKKVHTNICSTVKFCPKKAWEVVSGGLDSKIVLWDYSRGKPLHSFDLSSQQRGQQQLVNPPFVHSIDVSEDGGLLAAGVGDFSACIYHLPSRKLVHRLEAHMSSVSQVMFPAFAPMNHVLSAGNDNLILLWCLPSLASYSRKKKNKSQSECNIDSSAESQPVLKLEHSSKINWIATSNTPVVFVADQTSDISVYSLK